MIASIGKKNFPHPHRPGQADIPTLWVSAFYIGREKAIETLLGLDTSLPHIISSKEVF